MAMNPTVGEQLRLARERKGLDIREASRETHIRVHFLQELENDHPELLPSDAQARGFLRLYAGFLGIDANPLIRQWQEQEQTLLGEEKIPEDKGQKPEKKEKLDFLRNIISILSKKKSEEKKESLANDKKEEPKPQAPIVISQTDQKTEETSQTIVGSQTPIEKLQEKQEEAAEGLPQRSSQELFNEIGTAIKGRREKMGLSISDAEMMTKLKRIYIQAIEQGNFDDLPSTVQGRGMLFNYAKFLDMDDDAVMSLYSDALHIRRIERTIEKRKQKEPPVVLKINVPENIRRLLTPDLLIGGGLVLALFVFIFWGAVQIFTGGEGQPTESPSVSDVLQFTVTSSPASEAEMLNQTPQEQITQVPGALVNTPIPSPVATVNTAPLQLYIVAQQRTWMRITTDGTVVFEGRTVPDDVYTYSANQRIDLVTGNGAALEVYFNQDYLGKLGGVGEVLNLSFTLGGLTEATPTQTPQPSATPTPQPTQTEMMMEGNEGEF